MKDAPRPDGGAHEEGIEGARDPGPGLFRVEGESVPERRARESVGDAHGEAGAVPAAAPKTPSVRIHGRVCSERGDPIPKAAVEVEFSDREEPRHTEAGPDGSYEFELGEADLSRRSPIGLRAYAEGFVQVTHSLWSDRSGFLIEGNERKVDLELRFAQELNLRCVFEEGSPIANATVELHPTNGLGTWFVLGTEPEASGRTDKNGSVRIPGMPSRGSYRAVLGLEGLPAWFETPLDLRPEQSRVIVAPAPCTLRVELDPACLAPGDEECAPTHVRLLVNGGAPGANYDATGYYRLDGGVCSVPGLRLGDSVELRLLCHRGTYNLLARDLRIVERNQTSAFDPSAMTLVREPVLPLAGVQHPLRVKWRLIDGYGSPITNQRFGSLDVGGFRGTWWAGPDTGPFSLHVEDTNSFADVYGYLELPIVPPATLLVSGYGTAQETLVGEDLQTIDVTLDLDAMQALLARLYFNGVSADRDSVGVLEVVLENRQTGHSYRALRSTLRSSMLLQVSLPTGTYDYKAISTGLGQLAMTYQRAIGNGNPQVEAVSTGETSHRGTFARAVPQWKTWFDAP